MPLLDRFPFREDEAIYAYWALHAWHEDPLFLTVWPDKPPLFLWLLSGTFQLFGTSAPAARWINIALSTLTIPLVAVCARKLNQRSRLAPLVAATTVALNPFAITFSATAFTDPMLVFCGMMTIYMALCGRSFWAGIWLAAAIMTKQQGLFYGPLIVGLLYNVEPRTWRSAIHFLIGMLLIVAPILYWDSLRWATAPSPWDLSVRNYGALALLPPSQWIERASVWGDLLWYLTASWWSWGVLAVAGVLWCWQRFNLTLALSRLERTERPLYVPLNLTAVTLALSRLEREPSRDDQSDLHFNLIRAPRVSPSPRLGEVRRGSKQRKPHHVATHLLTLWTIAFIIIHMITTIQPWDRYLLPLAPILALLVGCAFAKLMDVTSPAQTKHGSERERFLSPCRGRASTTLLTIAWIALLIAPSVHAAVGDYPIGGDHGAYTGLDDAIAWIDNESDERTIVYHRALGWHYRFYLYEQIRSNEVELRWFPHAVYLVDNAAKIAHRRRFVIEPAWSPVRDLAQQALTRRLDVTQRAQIGDFIVLELSHEPQPFCEWCLCRLPSGWLHTFDNN